MSRRSAGPAPGAEGSRIHGFHPVREALRHDPRGIARVLIGHGRGGGRRREIEDLCRRRGVEVRLVDETLLGPDPAVHNGFAAERLPRAAAVRLAAAEAPEARAEAGGDPEFQVLVEDVQDPRNLGALLRVCEGAGVGRVLVRDRGSAPLSETAVKASAGASHWIDVERVGNSSNAIEAAKAEGFWVYGADAAGDPPWSIDLAGKVLICLGGEEKGLRPLTRERCDRLIGLPMRGRVESLNLATAAAAILYEAVRQRTRG